MKYKMGALVTEATGKIGGMVAMGKGSGGVLRIKTNRIRVKGFGVPYYERAFQVLALNWRNMSESVKSRWYEFSFNGARGWNAYLAANLYFSRANRTLVSVPSLKKPSVCPVLVSYVCDSTTQTFTITHDIILAASLYMPVYASKPLSASASNPNKGNCALTVSSNHSLKTINVKAQYLSKYKIFPTKNMAVWVGLSVIEATSGFRSEITWYKLLVS